jgi:hypothetical protein
MRAREPLSAAERALKHSERPALLFDCPLGVDGPEVVDLRALDTPVSDVALKNAVRVAWHASRTLTVRVNGAPTAQVLALLHALARRAILFSPDHIEQFTDAHRVIARTDAAAPSDALLALFPVRVRAPSSSPSSSPSSPPQGAVCR